jgi:hypothetical protein
MIGGALNGPTLASNTARIGSSWTWSLTGGQPGNLAILFYSAAPTAPTLLSPGCYGHINLASNSIIGFQGVSFLGTAVWALTVPDNPAFCGVDLMTQAAILVGSNYYISNGIRHSIGI